MVDKRKRRIFIIIMFMLIIAYSIVILYHQERENKDRYKMYPVLENNNMIRGCINELFSVQGHVYVTLNDSIKYLIPHSINYFYKPNTINEFIQVGDTLVKHSESDTLYVCRDKTKYFFIIGKLVGEDTIPKLFRKK